MHQRGCREQTINGRPSQARVEPSPLFRDPPIDADDPVREQVSHQDQLAFERDRAFCLAEPELLDASPNLADHQDTDAETVRLHQFIPPAYVPVALLALADFGYDVGVEQISHKSISRG